MGQALSPRVVRSGSYLPTVPRAGGQGDDVIWRKRNLITRGLNGRYYEEAIGGPLETAMECPLVALTGTLTLTANSPTVTGTGTLFTTEARLGQRIVIIDEVQDVSVLIIPKRIVSDTEMEIWQDAARSQPYISLSGVTGYRMYRLFAVNDQLGALLSGKVIELDKGSLLSAGTGEFLLDGAELAGDSLDATLEPQISIYDATTGNYANYTLGMDTPAAPTLAAVGGGTKDMQAGNYSLVITPARTATGGYNNPSPRADVTLTTSDAVQITFPSPDSTHGQDAWDVWVTPFSATLGADLKYLEGPWFYYTTIPVADLVAGVTTIEWLDGEILGSPELITFDNDAPPQGEFMELLNFTPTLISCRGPGRSIAIASATEDNPVVFTTTNPHGLLNEQEVTISGGTGAWVDVNGTFEVTVIDEDEFSIPVDSAAFGPLTGTLIAVFADPAPGPFIAPAKPQNIEAFPIDLQFSSSPPETILGVISAQGRLYLLTMNSLQIAQATPDQTVPILIRPFWSDGFANTEQIVFLNGNLYGYTAGGPSKSIGEGDEIEAEKKWAQAVYEITKHWNLGQVLVAYDPYYDCIVFFHTADSRNEQGFWITRFLMYSPAQDMWVGDGEFSQQDRDSIVSGVATVSDELFVTMGGRRIG